MKALSGKRKMPKKAVRLQSAKSVIKEDFIAYGFSAPENVCEIQTPKNSATDFDVEAYYIKKRDEHGEQSAYLRKIGEDIRVFYAEIVGARLPFIAYTLSEFSINELLIGKDRRAHLETIVLADKLLADGEKEYILSVVPETHPAKRKAGLSGAQTDDESEEYTAFYWKNNKSVPCADEEYIPELFERIKTAVFSNITLMEVAESEEEKKAQEIEENPEEEQIIEEILDRQSEEDAVVEDIFDEILEEGDIFEQEDAEQKDKAPASEEIETEEIHNIEQSDSEPKTLEEKPVSKKKEKHKKKKRASLFSRKKKEKKKVGESEEEPKQISESENSEQPEPPVEDETPAIEQGEDLIEEKTEQPKAKESTEEALEEQPEEDTIIEEGAQQEEQEESLEESEQVQNEEAPEPEEPAENPQPEPVEETPVPEKPKKSKKRKKSPLFSRKSKKAPAKKKVGEPEKEYKKSKRKKVIKEEPEAEEIAELKEPDDFEVVERLEIEPVPAKSEPDKDEEDLFEEKQTLTLIEILDAAQITNYDMEKYLPYLKAALKSTVFAVPITDESGEAHDKIFVSKKSAQMLDISVLKIPDECELIMPDTDKPELRRSIKLKTIVAHSKTFIPVFTDYEMFTQVFGKVQRAALFSFSNLYSQVKKDDMIKGVILNPEINDLVIFEDEMEI